MKGLTLTGIAIERYSIDDHPGYYIDYIKDYSNKTRELFLGHDDFGVMDLMYGVEAESGFSDEDFLSVALDNIDEYIQQFAEDYEL